MDRRYRPIFAFLALMILSLESVRPAIAGTATQNAAEAKQFAEQARKLQRAVEGCRGKIRSGELDHCSVAIAFQQGRLVSIAEAEQLANELIAKARALCKNVQDQFERDREALQRQQDTIKLGQGELAEWTKRNEEAYSKALEAGVNLFLGGMAQDVDRLAKSVAAYKGWTARRAKAVVSAETAEQIRVAESKLEQAFQKYQYQLGRLRAAQGAKLIGGAKDEWDASRAQWKAAAQEIALTNEEVKGVLGNSMFADIRPDVDRDLVLAKQMIEEIGPGFFAKKYVRLLGPAAELGQFVADYGYDMTEAMESKKRVLQQYNLSDDYLRAVEALKDEMTRTTKAMNMCRDYVE